jgi:hypothetical protein
LILRDVFRSAREETYGSTEKVELGLKKQEKRRSGFGFKNWVQIELQLYADDFSAASIKCFRQ